MSGARSSAQLSTGKTTSAYSQLAVHHQSLTAMNSTRGKTLTTVS